MENNTTGQPDSTSRHKTCPVCGKGEMLPGTNGWTCSNFQLGGEKCGFTIFRSYNGYTLTDQDLAELTTRGATGSRQFISKSGQPYSASLCISGDKVRVFDDNNVIAIPCPRCGGRIRKIKQGYVCEHYFIKGNEHCAFYLPDTVCGRPITTDEAEDLFERGRTEVLDGFLQQEGKPYSSCLVVAEDGTVMIDGRICRCPKCGGTVYAGIKGYNCSNYRNPSIRCNFVVWRVIGKRNITVDDVRQLCTQGQTRSMAFLTMNDEVYEKSLYLDADYKVKMK